MTLASGERQARLLFGERKAADHADYYDHETPAARGAGIKTINSWTRQRIRLISKEPLRSTPLRYSSCSGETIST